MKQEYSNMYQMIKELEELISKRFGISTEKILEPEISSGIYKEQQCIDKHYCKLNFPMFLLVL